MIMAFLGMTDYSRRWIPDYARITQPLQSMTHDHGPRPIDTLKWAEDGLASFAKLKQAVTTAQTSGVPDPHQPFTQTVCEKDGFYVISVAAETKGKN